MRKCIACVVEIKTYTKIYHFSSFLVNHILSAPYNNGHHSNQLLKLFLRYNGPIMYTYHRDNHNIAIIYKTPMSNKGEIRLFHHEQWYLWRLLW